MARTEPAEPSRKPTAAGPLAREGARARTKVLVVVCLALFVDMLMYGAVLPALPSIGRELSLDTLALALLLASYAVGLVVATPLMGGLVDKVGPRGPFAAGLAALVATTALFAFSGSLLWLTVGRALQGVAAGVTWTAGFALLAELWDDQGRGRAMGLAFLSVSAGSLLGPAVGGALFDLGGRALPFVVIGAVALVDGALRLAWVPRAAEHAALSARGPTEPAPSPWRDPGVLRIGAVVLLAATALTVLEPTLPGHLQGALGASATMTGLVFATATLASGLVAPWVGAETGRRGPRGLFVVGALATALALAALGQARSVGGVALAMALLGLGSSTLMTPAVPALAARVDALGGGRYGAAYALFNVVYALGMAAGPLVGGALTPRLGLGPTLLGVAAALVVGVGLVALTLEGAPAPREP